MLYIKRGGSGEIVKVSREVLEGCEEPIERDSAELLAFLELDSESGNPGNTFLQSDLAFVRVLEDVINVLMDKGVLSFTDLPEPAQQKLMERQSLRKRKNSVGLMSDGDNDII